MAINKIDAPGITPATFWPQVINQLLALTIDKEYSDRIVSGFIKQGAMFNIGGVMYVADSDTAISLTEAGSVGVKITPSGATASASYVSTLSGIIWNASYKGWYDGSGNLIIRDYVYPGEYCIGDHIQTRDHIYPSGSSAFPYTASAIRTKKYGTYNVRYKIHISSSVVTGLVSQIYINGIASGTAQTYSGEGDYYSNQILETLAGDIVEIRLISTTSSYMYGYVHSFALCEALNGSLYI